MNRYDAKKIAEKITNRELKEMFDNAKAGITNWEEASIVNKGLTKGTAWNILAKGFDVEKEIHIVAKTNMVREFGKFLPEHLRPPKKEKQDFKPTHQEPNLDWPF